MLFQLHIAAANGFLDAVEFLLDHHVSVDVRDNESWLPIHAAAYWGQVGQNILLCGTDRTVKTMCKWNRTLY